MRIEDCLKLSHILVVELLQVIETRSTEFGSEFTIRGWTSPAFAPGGETPNQLAIFSQFPPLSAESDHISTDNSLVTFHNITYSLILAIAYIFRFYYCY